jgi:hypothetical protein
MLQSCVVAHSSQLATLKLAAVPLWKSRRPHAGKTKPGRHGPVSFAPANNIIRHIDLFATLVV